MHLEKVNILTDIFLWRIRNKPIKTQIFFLMQGANFNNQQQKKNRF